MVYSVVELIVYAFFAYSGMMMLIIGVAKEPPTTKLNSLVRSIYLFPCIICAFILANTDGLILSPTTSNIITNLNTTEVHTEQIASQIYLVDPIWIPFHILLGFVMIIFVINQLIMTFTKIGKPNSDTG